MQPELLSYFAQDPAACPRADPAQSSPPTVPVNLTVRVTRDTSHRSFTSYRYSLFIIFRK